MPVFATSDVVPFRFTPNIQHFIGPILTEGILTSGIMAIGRCLTEPEVRSLTLHSSRPLQHLSSLNWNNNSVYLDVMKLSSGCWYEAARGKSIKSSSRVYMPISRASLNELKIWRARLREIRYVHFLPLLWPISTHFCSHPGDKSQQPRNSASSPNDHKSNF